MHLDVEKVIFRMDKNLRHSQPGWSNHPIEFRKYKNETLGVVTHLQEYLKQTEAKRNGYNSLFISCLRPHKPVTSSTISR